jgi:hypothetical protein
MRRLRFEILEDRRVLAPLLVTNLDDAPVAAAGDAPGTLRQAIFDANQAADEDTIVFAEELSGTIDLAHVADSSAGPSALVVTSPITIQGNAAGITIGREVSGAQMRLFRVAGGGELTLENVSLANGFAQGAAGAAGLGGAIFVSAGGELQAIASTLHENVARGDGGSSGRGGAIYNDGGSVTIGNSTISGNSVENGAGATAGFGGAIFSVDGIVRVHHSTVTEGQATAGRGIYMIRTAAEATAILEIVHSIVAQTDTNASDVVATYDAGEMDPEFNGAHNIIRSGPTFVLNSGLQVDPLLGELADNGGPTWTHAFLEGSSAIDAGDPTAEAGADGVPEFDQRGAPYGRVYSEGVGNPVIDIGAFEQQPEGSTGQPLPGDYNGDWTVNAADYTVWRNTLWTEVEQYSGADGNGNELIDRGDYQVWKDHYGETMPMAESQAANVVQLLPTDARAPALPLNAVDRTTQPVPDQREVQTTAVSGQRTLPESKAVGLSQLTGAVIVQGAREQRPFRMAVQVKLQSGDADLLLGGLRFAGFGEQDSLEILAGRQAESAPGTRPAKLGYRLDALQAVDWRDEFWAAWQPRAL